MRRAFPSALLALLALIEAGGDALAQEPPPDRPGRPPALGADVPRPPERPDPPLPEPQGRLIPPEEMPPLATGGEGAPPNEAAPATQGRLIPPAEMPPPGKERGDLGAAVEHLAARRPESVRHGA